MTSTLLTRQQVSSGLKQFGKTNQNENLATKQHLTKWATMAQLKSYVYGAFIDFLYNGKEYFHADSILHTGIYNNGKHKTEYDGVAFSHINGFGQRSCSSLL